MEACCWFGYCWCSRVEKHCPVGTADLSKHCSGSRFHLMGSSVLMLNPSLPPSFGFEQFRRRLIFEFHCVRVFAFGFFLRHLGMFVVEKLGLKPCQSYFVISHTATYLYKDRLKITCCHLRYWNYLSIICSGCHLRLDDQSIGKELQVTRCYCPPVKHLD